MEDWEQDAVHVRHFERAIRRWLWIAFFAAAIVAMLLA